MSKLNQIINNSPMLSILFNRQIQRGQKYILRDHNDNPFKSSDSLIVEVLETQGKWIRFKHLTPPGTIFVNESLERSSFNFAYQRYE